MSGTMFAAVLRAPNQLDLTEVPIPTPGYDEALIRVSRVSICNTDIAILTGNYPVKPPVILGHEFVGVVEKLGPGVEGIKVGDRVSVSSATPCGKCNDCLASNGKWCQNGGALGAWKLGAVINGAHAEYVLIPHAQANLCPVPDDLSDEQVVLLGDTISTGLSASDSAKVGYGDTVVVFGQGPVGLCATAGARMRGASPIIAVDAIPHRLELAKQFGADIVLNPNEVDVTTEIKKITGGRGADIAIEAVGLQQTFEGALRALRPGGILSSLGIYKKDLTLPRDAFMAGVGDLTILTTSCPGGRERLRRLMNLVRYGRFDPLPLITHRMKLRDIMDGYRIFQNKLENVIKVVFEP